MSKKLFYVILFVILFVIGLALFLIGSDNPEKNIDAGGFKDTKELTEPKSIKESTEPEESSEERNTANYITLSRGGKVDVGIIFSNALDKDKDKLLFEIALNTHSVSLEDYKEISKYIKLYIDNKLIEKDFEWELENYNYHHFSGVLKIKNLYDGQPLVDMNTKSLKLVIKDIAGVTREHIYDGDNLEGRN